MNSEYRNQYTSQYFELIDIANKNKHILNISTITLIATLNTNKLNLEHFCSRFKHNNVQIKIAENGRRKYFYNQITLNYKDISKKSIKIFSNGKLQITGLTCAFECNRLLTLIVKWLTNAFEESIYIIDSYIGMINGNFSIRKPIDLLAFNYLLCNNEHTLCIYNPESYPAINIKLNHNGNRISVFVFGTGNIVITGSKSIPDMKHAYLFITNMMKKYPNIYKDYNVDIIKKVESIVHGYTIRQYLSCIV